MSKESSNNNFEFPSRLGWLLLLISMMCTLFYGIELMNQAELCDGAVKIESTKQ